MPQFEKKCLFSDKLLGYSFPYPGIVINMEYAKIRKLQKGKQLSENWDGDTQDA